MREMITLQFGECGNRMGSSFWEVISGEHGIDPSDGKYIGKRKTKNNKLEVFFNESNNGYYHPRSILIDTEPGILDDIRSGPNGKLFNPENIIFSSDGGASGNFGVGYYTQNDLKERVMDKIRKEVETCDCFHGFQVLHSVGGGTGSGFASRIMSEYRDFYPDRISCTYSVFPSPKISNNILEPYNTIFTIHQMVENVDMTFLFDNEALNRICFNKMNIPTPKYKDLNNLISTVISSITSTLRFPGQRNADLLKQALNLVMFPRLHFFMVGHSPFPGQKKTKNMTVEELTNQIFSKENIMCSSDPHEKKSGKYLSAQVIYRGDTTVGEIDQEIVKIRKKYEPHFTEWLPGNISTSCCDIPPKGVNSSATILGNNTSEIPFFRAHVRKYQKLFRRKAFLHMFTGAGTMDVLEFPEAETNVEDLISELQQYRDYTDEWDDELDNSEYGYEEEEEEEEEGEGIDGF